MYRNLITKDGDSLGLATENQITAADATPDGNLIIDRLGTPVVGDDGLAAAVLPLRVVHVETATEADEYDEWAHRYRKVVVRAMRRAQMPFMANRLDEVKTMDPERDRLAWQIHDQAGDSTAPHCEWMRGLAMVWERSMPLDDLREEVEHMENLCPAD